ncbi:hypothetical protein U0070_014035 [Myodes glareolus]|uniref:Selenoprotein W n=1 Tax=Myodes glareolus TaxID=447135 RepID=A0AAW0HLA5_MYOGA
MVHSSEKDPGASLSKPSGLCKCAGVLGRRSDQGPQTPDRKRSALSLLYPLHSLASSVLVPWGSGQCSQTLMVQRSLSFSSPPPPPPPRIPRQEEERATETTGEFEVFVDGKLVHSKKKGDGFVDETGLKKLMGIIDEEIKKR